MRRPSGPGSTQSARDPFSLQKAASAAAATGGSGSSSAQSSSGGTGSSRVDI
jgi:hypothetical protein